MSFFNEAKKGTNPLSKEQMDYYNRSKRIRNRIEKELV